MRNLTNGFHKRLDRLERRQPAPEAHQLPAHFWDIMSGVMDTEDLDSAKQQKLCRFFEEGEAEHARCMERHPAGQSYRQQLTRLGLPQPLSLADIDVIEECIRLVGIPSPGASANGHQPDAELLGQSEKPKSALRNGTHSKNNEKPTNGRG
jgi:hypothetical protein